MLRSQSPHPALPLEQRPTSCVIEPPIEQTDEGFGVRKNDPETLAAFNEWIEARTDDGWLVERYDYWFRAATGPTMATTISTRILQRLISRRRRLLGGRLAERHECAGSESLGLRSMRSCSAR